MNHKLWIPKYESEMETYIHPHLHGISTLSGILHLTRGLTHERKRVVPGVGKVLCP